MAANQTRETETSVDAFLDAVEPPERRADARALAGLLGRITGEPARLWGPAIIGFGSRHYRYESGREGDMPLLSFAARKAQLVIYGTGHAPRRDELLARIGKHSTGKGCLNIKRLADVDAAVLEALLADALAAARS